MTHSARQPAILVALVLVMIAVYARSCMGPSRPARSAPGPRGETRAQPLVSGEPATPPSGSREAQRQQAMRLAWTRDPFVRAASVGEVNAMNLSGILWDAHQPLAIINGQTVRAGDELEGFRIVEIERDHVSVTDGAQTFRLRLGP